MLRLSLMKHSYDLCSNTVELSNSHGQRKTYNLSEFKTSRTKDEKLLDICNSVNYLLDDAWVTNILSFNEYSGVVEIEGKNSLQYFSYLIGDESDFECNNGD